MTFLVLAFEVVDLGYPIEAHQPEHSTTCCMATPTVLENKMPFLKTSIDPLVKRLSLVPFALSLPLQRGI